MPGQLGTRRFRLAVRSSVTWQDHLRAWHFDVYDYAKPIGRDLAGFGTRTSWPRALADGLEMLARLYGGIAAELPEKNERCGLDRREARCADCPYWPICKQAANGAWNGVGNAPANWREMVNDARNAL